MKKFLSKLGYGLVAISAVICAFLTFCGIVYFLVTHFDFSSDDTIVINEEYSKDAYYIMENAITDENIKFYVHDSQIYLDDTFSKPVGTMYKREDDSSYLEYKDKEYSLSKEDLELIKIEKKD